ncbi:MAG: asparagine synthase (glutamine-hydrolyzing) [Betaproteobacteria bacterium]
MCGIAALIRPPGAPAAICVADMAATVAHRGPDGQGAQTFAPAAGASWHAASDGPLGLAHTRLSIVDLSASGHQPMTLANGRWWITYNGEIYNHQALREELQVLGHAFRSRSDTEVLLAAWAQWGPQCLARLNGIFAFVLLDLKEGRVWAVRDRFGVKPLYWWQGPDSTIALASEIKQFTVLPGWSARMQPQRAYDFLAWNVIDHTPHTLFQGVHQLRGGELLSADLAALQRGATPVVSRWYTLRPDSQAAKLDRTESAQRFRVLLTDSVRLQLQADVDVGSCLSGGLDSSSVVCVARQLLAVHGGQQSRQHVFSARADVARYDEGHFIEAVVAATGVQPHAVVPQPEALFALLPDLAWHQDEPYGSTSAYAQWQVFALARGAGVKVLLDGQGADEALGGYHGFFGPRLADLARRGRWLQVAREVRALQRLHRIGPLQSLARLADPLLPDVLRQRLRAAAHRPSAQVAWLDHGRLGAVPADPFATQGARQPTVRALSQAQLLSTNLPMLLHCEDRNSMAHGVEARVPFLDHRLVEFALGLDDAHKVSDGITKRVLRDAMAGVLPETVRQRHDKLGFVTPEEVWVRRDPGQFRQALGRAVEQSQGVLRPQLLQSFDAMLEGRQAFGFEWWRAIAFGAWMDRFSVQG